MTSAPRDDRVKRGVDVVVGCIGLGLASPLMAVAAIAIWVDSRGPVIFRQVRVGQGGQRFTMYKFRTMEVGTSEAPTHDVSPAAVTRVGRVLRRTKVDELPQLLNVVRGDMSLVGPRPGLITQTTLAAERSRLGVAALRPGITGPAQIAGVDMSDPERLAEIDSTYIHDRSFLYDLRCILATLGGRGVGDRTASEPST